MSLMLCFGPRIKKDVKSTFSLNQLENELHQAAEVYSYSEKRPLNFVTQLEYAPAV